VPGCTDPLANNFDPSATINDGSCTYDPISISPSATMALSETISETSGLTFWDGYLWTHNDGGDTKLYGIDTSNADIKIDYLLHKVTNHNWEEISQDKEYLYIGDFGNNLAGNRTDLHLLRIEKNSLKSGNPIIDTIWYSYSDQYNFDPLDSNETNFDCEAFIVSEDSIYLFTKQWLSVQTSVYILPKIPGAFVAKKKATYNIQGLVSGASYFESSRLLVLCGYTGLLHPFLYLFYDFSGSDFFLGNKRRVTLSLPFHQVEGIASNNGLKYYITNESFVRQPLINSPQKAHILNLDELLKNYMLETSSDHPYQGGVLLFPNPASALIKLKIGPELKLSTFEVIDQTARVVIIGVLTHEITTVEIGHLSPGYYSVRISNHKDLTLPFLKL